MLKKEMFSVYFKKFYINDKIFVGDSKTMQSIFSPRLASYVYGSHLSKS